MNKISQESARCLHNGFNFSQGNTNVQKTDDGTVMRLHGNQIALITDKGELLISNGGYPSKTTTIRLKAILADFVGARLEIVRSKTGQAIKYVDRDETILLTSELVSVSNFLEEQLNKI